MPLNTGWDLQNFIFSNFCIKAAKNDTIGLTISVGLLTKVLAAAAAIEAEQVTVRSVHSLSLS